MAGIKRWVYRSMKLIIAYIYCSTYRWHQLITFLRVIVYMNLINLWWNSLIAMALTGSTGMTLLILACTLDQSNWWPAIVTIFYIICPLPLLVSKQISNDGGFGNERNPSKEWAYFLTTGIVMSTFILPIILCRTDVVSVTWVCLI